MEERPAAPERRKLQRQEGVLSAQALARVTRRVMNAPRLGAKRVGVVAIDIVVGDGCAEVRGVHADLVLPARRRMPKRIHSHTQSNSHMARACAARHRWGVQGAWGRPRLPVCRSTDTRLRPCSSE